MVTPVGTAELQLLGERCQRTLNGWLKPCVVESCMAGYVQNIMTKNILSRTVGAVSPPLYFQEYSLGRSACEERRGEASRHFLARRSHGGHHQPPSQEVPASLREEREAGLRAYVIHHILLREPRA